MGRVMLFLIGAVVGATLFHAYYLRIDPSARCGWDHPLDQKARSACRAAAIPATYTEKARRALDDLVGNFAR